jgi:membrane-bound serine protease (ClpP class)
VTGRTRRGWFRWFGGDDLVLERGAREAGDDDDWLDERLLLEGHQGIALSYLRPAGIAEIDGHRVDVVTEGEYIAAGDRIEVLRDDGYRRVVRRVPDDPDGSPA